MAMKLAFMAIVPDADPAKHQAVIATEFAELTCVLVPNMQQAIEKAKQLADEGCSALELCGGFGHSMTGKVAEAVKGKMPVGAVRFDFHGALGMSADQVFGG
ncbi:MAG: DUF6506 family protein [Dehalococcoidia bacterium]